MFTLRVSINTVQIVFRSIYLSLAPFLNRELFWVYVILVKARTLCVRIIPQNIRLHSHIHLSLVTV